MKNHVSDKEPPSKSRRVATADHDLLRYDRSGWAWEFLRLNPKFREALAANGAVKRRTASNITTIETTACAPEVRGFGICFAESPDDHYYEGGVFWRADFDPSILHVSADSGRGQSADLVIDFRRMDAEITILKLDKREYVRIAADSHSIALEVVEGSVLQSQQVRLRCHIDDLRHVPAQLLTLDRIYTIWRHNKFKKADFRADNRRHRWMLALQALELDLAGYSHRQIAEAVLHETNWRQQGGSLRSRVRRIIALGHDLSANGYLQILNGRTTKPVRLRNKSH